MADPGPGLTAARVAAIQAELAEFGAPDRHAGSDFVARVKLYALLTPEVMAELLAAWEALGECQEECASLAALAIRRTEEIDAALARVAALEAENATLQAKLLEVITQAREAPEIGGTLEYAGTQVMEFVAEGGEPFMPYSNGDKVAITIRPLETGKTPPAETAS